MTDEADKVTPYGLTRHLAQQYQEMSQNDSYIF